MGQTCCRVFLGVAGMMGDLIIACGITVQTSKTSGGSHFFCWPGGSEREELEIKVEDNFFGLNF